MALNAGCFIVFLCQYIHSFIFPEMAGVGGATAPLATPLNPPLITHAGHIKF